jgi:hypothetical protein
LVAVVLICALAQSAPELQVSVDRDRPTVGEEVLYTIRAVSRSSEPMDLSIAPLNGFEIVSRSERTEVSFSGGPTRTTVLEIRLRALRPGRWQIGPARASQGRKVTEAAAVIVDVEPGPVAATPALNPRLRSVMDRAPPPPRGKAGVTLIVSADSVNVGEQVDVVTAAWFPRDLRLQLRRPPTLQPPVIDGVWSYPQSAPAGIAATRNIGGSAYDLFVAHQVVFPLLPGTIAIPSAMLKYSTPLALQFFSQEERFALSSLPETLTVRALPTAGRPSGFNGAVGSNLRLERRVSPPVAHPGEGIAIELVLAGEGNTALWPPPEIKWPSRVRAYVDRVEEQVSTAEGRIGGVKTFRYLVVPDSAGPLALPAVGYSYYDLAARGYRTAAVAPAALPVEAGREAAASVALPPPLLEARSPSLAWRLASGIPDWLWVMIFLGPPGLLMARGRPRRRRFHAPAAEITGLRAAQQRLDSVVEALVPDPDQRSRVGLAAAIRAAGADLETAGRVASLRERLLARRYGPPEPGQDESLVAEVEEVVLRLGGSLRSWRAGITSAGLFMALSAGCLVAQAPAPENLYQAGAVRPAAEAFSRRAELEPAVAAHWYNLGAAHYRLGAKGRAMAAWLRARRLAPREPTIMRALRLTPAPDVGSARLVWTPPVTPEELLLLGALGWIMGWGGWVMRPRLRDRWIMLLVFAAITAAAGLGLRVWYRQPVALVLDQTTLRLSPHGLAPALGPLEAGGAVEMLRRQRGWVLVRAGTAQGWVASEAIAPVSG